MMDSFVCRCAATWRAIAFWVGPLAVLTIASCAPTAPAAPPPVTPAAPPAAQPAPAAASAPAAPAAPAAPPVSDWKAAPTNGSPGVNVPKLSGNDLLKNNSFEGGKYLP